MVQNEVDKWLNIGVIRSATRLVTGDVSDNYVKELKWL